MKPLFTLLVVSACGPLESLLEKDETFAVPVGATPLELSQFKAWHARCDELSETRNHDFASLYADAAHPVEEGETVEGVLQELGGERAAAEAYYALRHVPNANIVYDFCHWGNGVVYLHAEQFWRSGSTLTLDVYHEVNEDHSGEADWGRDGFWLLAHMPDPVTAWNVRYLGSLDRYHD